MNEKTKSNLKDWEKDVTKILQDLNLPDEVKMVLMEVMEKMTLEQVDELVRTLYQRLIEQKTAEVILENDSEFQDEKEKLDNKTLEEINKILN